MKPILRNLVIDETEYSDSEIQFMQKAIDAKGLKVYLFRDIVNGYECLCAIANINYSYNEVLCIIGDAYIGENADEYPV